MSAQSLSRNPPSASTASSAARQEKSLQTLPGSQDIQPVASNHVSLRDMVLTPARVPPFIIPPLCGVRRPGLGTTRGGARRYTLPASAHSPQANRALCRRCCSLSPFGLTCMEPHTCALSDPGTRAAMSLLHLSKITTPYGFVTLGESPCVRRRESLFFQEDQPQPGPSEGEQQCYKSRSESSSQSCDTAARCSTALQPEHHLPTPCDCSKVCTCTHRPNSSQRKGKLKYLLKKRFAA